MLFAFPFSYFLSAIVFNIFQAGVVSLQKLLVREKAGQESRGIYLISSNPTDPEMFELKVHKPKDKQVWIQAIRYFHHYRQANLSITFITYIIAKTTTKS